MNNYTNNQMSIIKSLVATTDNAESAMKSAFANNEWDKVDDLQIDFIALQNQVIESYVNLSLTSENGTDSDRNSVKELIEKAKTSPTVRTKIINQIRETL